METPHSLSPSKFQIVAAHHNEDLKWLYPYAQNTIIYSKGRLPPPPQGSQFYRVQTLPNIGRESHSYLYHLYHYYDSLAEVTLFTQGDIYNETTDVAPHSNLPLTKMVSMALDTPRYGMTSYAALKMTFLDWDKLLYVSWGKVKWMKVWASSLTPARLSPAEFWKYVHDGEEHPKALQFHAHGLFAVRAETVRLRPRAFWERLWRYFEDLNTLNPEEGLYMERMWASLFAGSHMIRRKFVLTLSARCGFHYLANTKVVHVL